MDSNEALASSQSRYDEDHRPQFHFSPEANWMNDPNGMVYHEGEYHLFYQYYPDSTVWGPMHWGHAVSHDMVHWEHLPIGLYPDTLGDIFSGSAVVDKGNTSGLGAEGKDPLIAIFTHHNMEGERAGTNTYQNQSIAYSHDNGRTWTKYEGNPVISNPGIKDFRDPKVIWHKESQSWIMVFAAYDKDLIYTSPNLIDWEKSDEFGIVGDKRLWECPDLFPMKVVETGETKWVLITSIQQEAPNGGTATAYFVGDFDGRDFVGNPDNMKWMDYGKDNYAMVTWANIPDSDGRTLGIGWMSNWQYAQVVPTEKWRSAMTLPRELTLHQLGDDFVVYNAPVQELEQLRISKVSLKNGVVIDNLDLVRGLEQNGLLELELTFKKPEAGIIDIRLSNSLDEYVSIGYSSDDNIFFVDRTFSGKTDFSDDYADFHIAPRLIDSDMVEMHLFVDHSSVEVFADDGSTVMTEIFFPNENFNQFILNTEMNEVELVQGTVCALKRIW